MSFFKKLFGNTNEKSSNIPSNQTIPKRIIFDFFQIDLKNIPDDSFIAGEIEENSSGQSVQNFRKTLSYKECGIFDTVEVKVIGGESKNVFFKSFNPDSLNFGNLKLLIDELYLIYGNDSSGKGKFVNKDKEDYRDNNFYMLFGRSWIDYPKYTYPVRIDRDEYVVSISIWDVNKS